MSRRRLDLDLYFALTCAAAVLIAALRDDTDAMLEIFGMASVDDVYSIDTVQL